MKTRSNKSNNLRSHSTSKASRQRLVIARRQKRRSYPVHKRAMLHPIGLFSLLCVGVFMASWTYRVLAATTVSSTIEAPPLTAAAALDSPVDHAVFSTPKINVIGTCPTDSYVTLMINSVFSGVAWCNSGGYNISASLYSGFNALLVQAYNSTNLAGPNTMGITLTYNAPSQPKNPNNTNSPPPTKQTSTSYITVTPDNDQHNRSTASSNLPLLLTSSFQFHSFTQNKNFTWDVNLGGGTPPYQLEVNWGDKSTTNMILPNDPLLTLHHLYAKPGYYPVILSSNDATGNQSSLQLAALITDSKGNSPFMSSNSTNSSGPAPGAHTANASFDLSELKWIVVAWTPYLVIALMTISFWLGERREFSVIGVPKRHRR